MIKNYKSLLLRNRLEHNNILQATGSVAKRPYPKKYISLVVLSLVVLMVIQIWVSNNVVAYGEKLEKLSSLSNSLYLENQLLENEIAGYGALINIASKSAEIGFIQASSIKYIR